MCFLGQCKDFFLSFFLSVFFEQKHSFPEFSTSQIGSSSESEGNRNTENQEEVVWVEAGEIPRSMLGHYRWPWQGSGSLSQE